MKTFGIILIALAIGAGLAGQWCATAVMAWTAYEAWTWDVQEAIEVQY
jgi:hypothetical protein